MMRTIIGAGLLLLAAAAAAEAPQDLAKRLNDIRGAKAVLNTRDDGSFGSLTISLERRLVESQDRLAPVIAEIGRFAAAGKLKVDILTHRKEDADFMEAKLKEAGEVKFLTRVMAETVSNKTTRIFVVPDRGAAERPVLPPPPPVPAPAAAPASAPAKKK